MTKVKAKVYGMGCLSCVNTIEGKLNETRGVKADISISEATVSLQYDEKIISFEDITKIVENLGYGLEKM